jgi:hypothetical protein
MSNYIQKSYQKKFGNKDNSMETNIIEDVSYLVEKANNTPSPAYKVYTALLTQSGTDAPVATVLENTLGGDVVWTRDNIGQFIVTSNNLFTAYKTAVFITPTSASSGYPVFAFDTDPPNEDNLYIYSYGAPSGAPDNYEDGKLNKTTVEIRVYN